MKYNVDFSNNNMTIEVLEQISEILFNSYYINKVDDIFVFNAEEVNFTLLKIGFKYTEIEIKIITDFLNIKLNDYKLKIKR